MKEKDEESKVESKTEVKETAVALKEALNDTEEARAEARKASHAFVFESANAAKLVPLPKPLAQLVETAFFSPEEMPPLGKRLREGLSLGDKRGEHGHLMKSNDNIEGDRHAAFRLFITAKIEYEKWERENEVVFGVLRAEANRVLQREKDLKERNKAITDADVTAKMAELFPDEWNEQETLRRAVKATVEIYEDLFESYESRCRTLNSMLTKAR